MARAKFSWRGPLDHALVRRDTRAYRSRRSCPTAARKRTACVADPTLICGGETANDLLATLG